ncbi:MAG: type II toxin-antitoxin system HicB family antitoxin [Candidatus Pacearchaeota archaeon]
MEIKIVLEEQEEGGYTVSVPSLQGCISQGETVDEALKNIKEAIELYMDSGSDEDFQDKGEVMNIKL